jgi:Rnl2 family RNA ligase
MASKLGFCEYEHMENHYNMTKHIEEAQRTVSCLFVATEKIHGTNYSLMSNGLTVEPCKRSSPLGTDRGYFGHGPVYDKYKSDILTLFVELSKKYWVGSPNDDIVTQIQLYGELFGGLYDGKTTKGYKKVQKMDYCPFNDFMAYDLKVTTTKRSFYVDFVDLIDLFKSHKLSIRLVPIIFIGSLTEIMKLNANFETCVPAIYDLDVISQNYAEGYVVKPMVESSWADGTRLIFKYKNPTFSEIKIGQLIQTNEKSMTFQQICLAQMKMYVTENRFDNIFTKLDDTSQPEDKKKLIQMMIDDVVCDFKDDANIDNVNHIIRTEDNIIANMKAFTGFVTGFILSSLKKHK